MGCPEPLGGREQHECASLESGDQLHGQFGSRRQVAAHALHGGVESCADLGYHHPALSRVIENVRQQQLMPLPRPHAPAEPAEIGIGLPNREQPCQRITAIGHGERSGNEHRTRRQRPHCVSEMPHLERRPRELPFAVAQIGHGQPGDIGGGQVATGIGANQGRDHGGNANWRQPQLPERLGDRGRLAVRLE